MLTDNNDGIHRYLDSVNQIILNLDIAGIITSVNRMGMEFIGMERSEIKGRPFFINFIPEDKGPDAASAFESFINDDSIPMLYYKSPLINQTGESYPILWLYTKDRDKTGNLRSIQCYGEIRDEMNGSPAVLVNSDLPYQNLFRYVPLLVCRFMSDGGITFVNDYFLSFFRMERENILNSNFFWIIDDKNWRSMEEQFHLLNRNNAWSRYEQDIRCSSGKRKWLRWTNQIIAFNEKGMAVEYQAIGEDITLRKHDEEKLKKAYEKLKRTRDKLVQSEKLAGMGKLAACVAHDIRNPLQVVIGMSELIKDDLEGSRHERDISTLCEAGLRINDIVNNLNMYSRDKKRNVISRVDLNQVILKSLDSTRLTSDFSDVNIDMDLDKIPNVNANEGELLQVFINIIKNSIDAMDGTGNITIRSTRTNGKVEVEVTDTGKGFAPREAASVFEPFYTTKKHGKGTGLGLYIVKQIVDSYGGIIIADSIPGKGTTFKISFPDILG